MPGELYTQPSTERECVCVWDRWASPRVPCSPRSDLSSLSFPPLSSPEFFRAKCVRKETNKKKTERYGWNKKDRSKKKKTDRKRKRESRLTKGINAGTNARAKGRKSINRSNKGNSIGKPNRRRGKHTEKNVERAATLHLFVKDRNTGTDEHIHTHKQTHPPSLLLSSQ
jgi:hypothetical protein